MTGESREVAIEPTAPESEGLFRHSFSQVPSWVVFSVYAHFLVLSVTNVCLCHCLGSRMRVPRSVVALIPSIVSEYASGSF
jgi:hypothetical protein